MAPFTHFVTTLLTLSVILTPMLSQAQFVIEKAVGMNSDQEPTIHFQMSQSFQQSHLAAGTRIQVSYRYSEHRWDSVFHEALFMQALRYRLEQTVPGSNQSIAEMALGQNLEWQFNAKGIGEPGALPSFFVQDEKRWNLEGTFLHRELDWKKVSPVQRYLRSGVWLLRGDLGSVGFTFDWNDDLRQRPDGFQYIKRPQIFLDEPDATWTAEQKKAQKLLNDTFQSMVAAIFRLPYVGWWEFESRLLPILREDPKQARAAGALLRSHYHLAFRINPILREFKLSTVATPHWSRKHLEELHQANFGVLEQLLLASDKLKSRISNAEKFHLKVDTQNATYGSQFSRALAEYLSLNDPIQVVDRLIQLMDIVSTTPSLRRYDEKPVSINPQTGRAEKTGMPGWLDYLIYLRASGDDVFSFQSKVFEREFTKIGGTDFLQMIREGKVYPSTAVYVLAARRLQTDQAKLAPVTAALYDSVRMRNLFFSGTLDEVFYFGSLRNGSGVRAREMGIGYDSEMNRAFAGAMTRAKGIQGAPAHRGSSPFCGSFLGRWI